MDPAQFPKIELHLHLDCSLSYEVIAAIDPSISRAIFEQEFVAPAKCKDLADFLTRPPRSIALMQTRQALEWVVKDLFQQLQKDHVIYAEIRFAPHLHTEIGLSPREVVTIVEAATEASISATGIEARLILCTLRHYSAEQSMETVKLVNLFKGSTVAGFDIAADEAGYPINAHIEAFQYAHAHGIPCTAHAGEALGPASVRETLKNFGVKRIGHGVRSIEDPTLVDYLIQNRIHLEICPSCNVQIDLFDEYKDHPINRFYQAGVSLSINTDGRTLVDIDLNREYQKLAETFGWTAKDFLHCNKEAIRVAFIPESLKHRLLQQLEKGYTIVN